jgi:hypothetical protein
MSSGIRCQMFALHFMNGSVWTVHKTAKQEQLQTVGRKTSIRSIQTYSKENITSITILHKKVRKK